MALGLFVLILAGSSVVGTVSVTARDGCRAFHITSTPPIKARRKQW